jgi:N-acetyl-D-muramate 6-phosphate phosphatase
VQQELIFMAFNQQRVRALCFDLDGTLSDTDDLWIHRFENLLRALRFLLPQSKVRQLARRLVMGLESPITMAYTAMDHLNLDDDLAHIYNFLVRRGIGRKAGNFLLVTGVREMLVVAAHRYPLAIVSARDQAGTLAFLEQFNLLDLFTVIATSQTCRYTKPFPDPVIWAAGQIGISPTDCLMIGDTTVDILAGRAAGAQTVGVLCGFGRRDELLHAGADLIIESTSNLLEIL